MAKNRPPVRPFTDSPQDQLALTHGYFSMQAVEARVNAECIAMGQPPRFRETRLTLVDKLLAEEPETAAPEASAEPQQSNLDQLIDHIIRLVAEGAAYLVSVFRPISQVPLSDSECEQQGLPFGSAEPAVQIRRLSSMSLWRVGAQFYPYPLESPEGCLQILLLGHEISIFFLRTVANPLKAA